MDHHDPQENGEGHVYQTETFVFTGNGGPAFLATMQNLMNRMIHGEQAAQFEQNEQAEQQVEQAEQREQAEQHVQPEQHEHPEYPEHPRSDDDDMSAVDDPPVPDLVPPNGDENMPPLEPLSSGDVPPASRPIRPLPRPHTHFHAHTPRGIIDFFTFSVAGGPLPPPPPPPGTATFTFNLGPDVLAGFEAFFLGGMKDREPDPERARVLLRGMEIVPEGLVRRLERAGGVPGGQGNEESAGCAVCWGPLLDEVEPGEWDTAKEKAEKAKMAAEGTEKTTHDDDDLHGRIVALPCAHVYHAECLLPWFSRNTTCPMCRFDVDPESLTWTPRPPASDPPPQPHGIPPDVLDGVLHPDAQGPTDAHAEQHQRANAINAARFNAFVNSILRAGPLGHPQPPHSAPQSQPGVQPQQQQQQQQQQPQEQPQALPHFPAEPPFSGAAPPVSPPPNPFQLPRALPTMPVLSAPWRNNAGNNPPFPFPFPAFFSPQANPHIHPIPIHMSADEDPSNIPNPHTHTSQPPPSPRERKKWAPPEPVGKTLRQRVEEKERELGLRCDDMVCGVAPSDEDPTPAALESESGKNRTAIGAAYDAHGNACRHSFHPACLVTSARVAGVTGEEDEHVDGLSVHDGELQVACPVCRAVGLLTRREWDEGVQASEAEMA